MTEAMRLIFILLDGIRIWCLFRMQIPVADMVGRTDKTAKIRRYVLLARLEERTRKCESILFPRAMWRRIFKRHQIDLSERAEALHLRVRGFFVVVEKHAAAVL